MDAGTADKTIQARFDRFRGRNGFNQNPYLDHVAGFPVVGRFIESGCDYDTGVIFVENKSVHREPPIQRDCSQSPLMMIVVMIASQKSVARMRFVRSFMMFGCSDVGAHAKEITLCSVQQL